MKKIMTLLPVLMIMLFAFTMEAEAQPEVLTKYFNVEARGYGQTAVVRENQEIISIFVDLTDTLAQSTTFTLPINPAQYKDTLLLNYQYYMTSATDTAEYRVQILGSMMDQANAVSIGYIAATDSTYLEDETVQTGVLKIAPPFYPEYVFTIKPSGAAPTDIEGRGNFFPTMK